MAAPTRRSRERSIPASGGRRVDLSKVNPLSSSASSMVHFPRLNSLKVAAEPMRAASPGEWFTGRVCVRLPSRVPPLALGCGGPAQCVRREDRANLEPLRGAPLASGNAARANPEKNNPPPAFGRGGFGNRHCMRRHSAVQLHREFRVRRPRDAHLVVVGPGMLQQLVIRYLRELRANGASDLLSSQSFQHVPLRGDVRDAHLPLGDTSSAEVPRTP